MNVNVHLDFVIELPHWCTSFANLSCIAESLEPKSSSAILFSVHCLRFHGLYEIVKHYLKPGLLHRYQGQHPKFPYLEFAILEDFILDLNWLYLKD